MSQQLSLAYRPKSLDSMIGQKSVVKRVRAQIESGRIPAAWLFIGESGAGKTTIARNIAYGLQCKHVSPFGSACETCRNNIAKFDIVEINTAEFSGVEEIEQILAGSNYSPKPPSRKRVYIFDEAHKLSNAAQTLMLKYLEDSPPSTCFVITTTEPGKLLRTIRRRCVSYPLNNLTVEGVELLVKRALKFAKSDRDAEPLVERLMEAGITSPGFVVLAVEKYAAGEKADRAAQVGIDSSLNTLDLCRNIVQGNWSRVQPILMNANPEDARAIRQSLAGYLKGMLVRETNPKRAALIADSITMLVKFMSFEEGMQLAGTVAAVYNICRFFKG